jgi:ATP-dependent Clp protease ATP-binding subunit ClpC
MVRLTYADFEKSAVRTMQLANQSAWELNHDYIDTEHILIGLCRNQSPAVTAILTQSGVTVQQIMGELRSRVQVGSRPVARGKRPPQENAKHVTEHATQIASQLDATSVGNEHLILGLLFVHGATASDVLDVLGMRYDKVAAHIQGT